ncbi:hypothetical protein [Natrialbaceae archaeon AArc-T1-2]|uniref:hypothetical protein n=1 Tax=Natrialbaceae archaeon AArc-T1-2 TaxID=3053904 RepID=UPI00255AD919|nr:hypothetical protein [Natrialbaceae archaeon AArc-T1-2]WIV65772.1 hypothetical protein QQ977_08635 [Natrialbaceae archaeon AArc-T1-2]
MIATVLWSVTCLFAAVLVVDSIRLGRPFSRLATDVLLFSLWLVIGSVVVFEVGAGEGTVILAALATAGCYAVVKSAVRAGLIE